MIDINNISGDQLDERGMMTHEPRWMREQRQQSWEAFLASPELNWRRTKTPKCDIDATLKISFPKSGVEPLKVEKKVPEGCSGKITIKDNKVLRISILPELTYKGVIFCDMQTALLERADLIDQYLMKHEIKGADKLSHLHKALWENGYFLYVPEHLHIEEPFQVQIIHSSDQSLLQRHLIILDKDANATVEELFESEGSQKEKVINTSHLEVFTEENAQLYLNAIQNFSSNVYHLEERSLVAKRHSHIHHLVTELGAGAGRISIIGESQEEGAQVHHDGVISGTEDQRFKMIIELHHEAQHSEGKMRYKGILSDSSQSYLQGNIIVTPKAQGTSSRLEEHTLLMSKNAKCDALPALDIQTDDVNVSHAASVRQTDEDQLFYLMSRGLTEVQARQLLMEGFFEDILDGISRPQWYTFTKELLSQRLQISHD